MPYANKNKRRRVLDRIIDTGVPLIHRYLTQPSATKRNLSVSMSMGAAGHATKSSCSHKVKANQKTKDLSKGIGPTIINETSSGHVNAQNGRQYAQIVSTFYDYYHFSKAMTLMPSPATDARNAATYGVKTDQYFSIPYASCHTTFSNNNSHMIRMVIYDVICKKNTDEDPILTWNDGLIDEAFIRTNTGTTDTGIAAYQSTTIGSRPQLSNKFRTQWRVLKTTNVLMQTGETHDHYFTTAHPRMLCQTDWKAAVGGVDEVLNFRANYSVITLVVVSGVPGPSSTDANVVSTTRARVDFTQITKHHIKLNTSSVPVKTILYGNDLTQPTDVNIGNFTTEVKAEDA